MPQDAFTLYHSVRELNDILRGAKINRINQPDRDEVNLLVYTSSGSKMLSISANAENCRVAFTQAEKPNPKQAPNFCMLMRKHILGAIIDSVELIGFERITKMTFSAKNDFRENVQKVLYCEIMGKYSNLILTENGYILGCLKLAPLDVATSRAMLSGAKYCLPKPQDKVELSDKTASISRLSQFNGVELDKFLFENIKGFSYPTAIEASAYVNEFTSIENLYEKLYSFTFSPDIKPNIAGEGKSRDFYITNYKTIHSEKVFYGDISTAEDIYFTTREREKAFLSRQKQIVDKINGMIKKLSKKVQGESEKILSASDYESLRIKGELLTANLYRLKKGMTECTLENWYNNSEPIKIILNENLTPNENAQRLFKRYAKEKRTLEILIPQREQTLQELGYLNTILLETSQAKSIADFADIEEELISVGIFPTPKAKNKVREETPYRIYNIDGYIVKCGKNNIQNDRLTGRAFKDDIWLHTKDYHSSHVIIETNGTGIPDNVILQSAQICAYYSDAKQSSKVPVDYTFKKYVKKPPKSRPGRVIYTDYKTILVDPNPHSDKLCK